MIAFNTGQKKMRLNIAIIGGGRACRFFLEFLKKESLPDLDIHVLGVCDINPDAQGIQLARAMGIYTTQNYKDFFAIDNLDSILELTNSQELLLELIKQRPKGVGIVEHNIGRLLRLFFLTDQRMRSLEHQLLLEKMSSDILIQHSDAGILVLNTDFTVVEANEVFLKKVRKSREEVVGAFCYRISHGLDMPCPNARPDLQCPMIETLRTARSAHVIHEMPGVGFEAAYGNIVTYPLIDSHGQIIRIIEIWRDISDKIESSWGQRYKKLKREFDHLIQEDRMISLGKLAASCVHEINNPIQGLLTFADLMQSLLSEGRLGPEGVAEFREYLALMSTELERCGHIISGLLSFSRDKPSQCAIMDLNDIIRSVVDLVRHKMQIQGVALQIDLFPDPLLMNGDTHRMQQCMLNLLFNAMEAMPNGGRLRITSKCDEKEKRIVVEIEDSGQGIAESDLDRIFEPFFTTKPDGQGTGLGLSIVYNVVKSHLGDIKVQNRQENGCRFTLTFPQLDRANAMTLENI
jgi:two-component system NtrC family sensor kinase